MSSPQEIAYMRQMLPIFAQAVKFAENNPENLGVLSVNTDNPGKVLNNSVLNNFNRWINGQYPAPWIKEKPKKFVDFMQRRWAPIGAENDPDNLNQNWAPNVRWYLQQNLKPEEYDLLKRLDFVKHGYRKSQSDTV